MKTPKQTFLKIAQDYGKGVTIEVIHHCGRKGNGEYYYHSKLIRVFIGNRITWDDVSTLCHELGHFLTMGVMWYTHMGTLQIEGQWKYSHPLYHRIEGDATALGLAIADKYKVVKQTIKYFAGIDIGL